LGKDFNGRLTEVKTPLPYENNPSADSFIEPAFSFSSLEEQKWPDYESPISQKEGWGFLFLLAPQRLSVGFPADAQMSLRDTSETRAPR